LVPEIASMPALFTRLQHAGILPIERLPDTLDTLGDDELRIARDTARALVNDGGTTVKALEESLGHGALGLGVFRAASEMPRNWRIRVLLVVGIAALRRDLTPDERENLNALSGVLTQRARELEQDGES
jgi:hypothetical protein